MAGDLRELRLVDFRPAPAVRLPATAVERPSVPAIDAHNHLGRWLAGWIGRPGGWVVEDVPALVDGMDRLGLAAIVNLDGRWGAELEENLDRFDRAYPGRFATFCHVDWDDLLADAGGPARAVAGLERARDSGARGLKVWKDLGLGVSDRDGRLVLPDDPRLADVWAAAGALGLPVLIHTADPVAFWQPADARNERVEELARHPEWSFADPRFPPFERLMDALEAIVAGNPGTTFIGAHVACFAEDLGWVGRMLDLYSNLNLDISARLAELGRQPRAARALVLRHPDRVLLGTDAFPPEDDVYRLHWRFLETADEHFPYHVPAEEPPPQGRWAISALDLPPDVLALVEAGNARRLIPGLG